MRSQVHSIHAVPDIRQRNRLEGPTHPREPKSSIPFEQRLHVDLPAVDVFADRALFGECAARQLRVRLEEAAARLGAGSRGHRGGRGRGAEAVRGQGKGDRVQA
jgi:hypothetical protein